MRDDVSWFVLRPFPRAVGLAAVQQVHQVEQADEQSQDCADDDPPGRFPFKVAVQGQANPDGNDHFHADLGEGEIETQFFGVELTAANHRRFSLCAPQSSVRASVTGATTGGIVRMDRGKSIVWRWPPCADDWVAKRKATDSAARRRLSVRLKIVCCPERKGS